MREIKFRAWDGKKWLTEGSDDVIGIDLQGDLFKAYSTSCENPVRYLDGAGIILMQYTGLKDKNGKEIYEGDVVEGTPYITIGKKIKAVVIWNNAKAMYQVKEITNHECPDYEYLFEALREYHQTEVIGNIHENPELLNQ